MPAIAINRLRLRGPPRHAARSAFFIEDACRTELRDGERLVLIRRLALGVEASASEPRDRAACVRRAYGEATRDSRHGGSDSAAAANCVWFASRAEARSLLLRALLAGRRPMGWYWTLAVPEWHGQKLADWLGLVLAQAFAATSGDDPAALVLLAVEAGATDLVVEALGRGAAAAAPAGEALDRISADEPSSRDAFDAPPGGVVTIADRRAMLVRLRACLPRATAAAVELVCRRFGIGSRAATLLLERLLIKASPSLALSPILLGELTRAYGALLVGRDPGGEESPSAEPAGPARRAPASPAPVERPAAALAPPGIVGDESLTSPPADARGESVMPAQAEAKPLEVAPVQWMEARSSAAGLWLVLPPLIRMGLREWLAERPELLAGDPGRNLLRTIAVHHRVAPDDPVLGPLDLGEPWTDPPLWARHWRTGLDRWLRRRARISLARLVYKPGWLRMSEDRLVVRFPMSAIDLRLRRRALDVDPGWTDWIGLSVRYAFADRQDT